MDNIETTEMARQRRLGLTSLALGLTLGTFVLYAALGGLHAKPLPLPLEEQLQTQRWVPQGWAFFTRDPREPRTLSYQRDARGQWQRATLGPHASSQNAFGMNRASRAQSVELARLLRNTKATHWQSCTHSLERCAAELESHAITNLAPRTTLCGQLLLVKQQPLPWAYRRFAARSQMPRSVLRLEVSC